MSADAGVSDRSDRFALGGVVCAVLGVVAVALVYWLVLPAIVLGAGGVVLGVLAVRRGALSTTRDRAIVAICLGAVAIVFTPVVVRAEKAGEEWGRDCALDPGHDPNCPD